MLDVCCPECKAVFTPSVYVVGPRERRVEMAALKLVSRLWGRVSPDNFEVWIAPLVLVSIDREKLVLGGEKHLVDWGSQKLSAVIRTVALELAGHPMNVEFVVAKTDGARSLGELLTDGVEEGQIA